MKNKVYQTVIAFTVALPMLFTVSSALAVDASDLIQINPVNPVMPSGSDAASAAYNAFESATISPYITSQTNGFDQFVPTDVAGVATVQPPQSLVLSQDSFVRVYFLDSDAGFNNSLGMNTDGSLTVTAGDQSLIFGNANAPGLGKGDFVDIGSLLSGTALNTFLLADGADTTQYIF